MNIELIKQYKVLLLFCIIAILFFIIKPSISFSVASSPLPDMVRIPEGKFIMGTNDRHEDEGPEHEVYLKAYDMDLYELSNEKYMEFVKATGKRPPSNLRKGIPSGKENHPVVFVSWYDADAYCKWSGKRLPTEQEWEKAARGTDGRIYPWGNIFSPEMSNNPQKNSSGTEPVNSYEKSRSPYGLYNMSGNVWEWVDSYYLPHPGNKSNSPNFSMEKRILKGGSWVDCLTYSCGISAPLFNRAYFIPRLKTHGFGFRCARDITK